MWESGIDGPGYPDYDSITADDTNLEIYTVIIIDKGKKPKETLYRELFSGFFYTGAFFMGVK